MIRRRIEFCCEFREDPLWRAPTTPELSERKRRWTSLYPAAITAVSASSTATISSQPISRPSDFHPSMHLHAIHFPSIQKPTPQLVEASMQINRSNGAGGLRRVMPQKSADSWDLHQTMSSATLFVILWVDKGWQLVALNRRANSYNEGRCVRTAIRTREQ